MSEMSARLDRSTQSDHRSAQLRAMSTKEFARYVGVSPRTVYRWIQEQKIHPLRRGGQWLFGQREVDEVLHRA